MTAMTLSLAKAFDNTKIQISSTLFERLRKQVSSFQEQLQRVSEALQAASDRYEDLQKSQCDEPDNGKVENFGFDVSCQEYDMPYGGIHLELRFRRGHSDANSQYSTIGFEGLDIDLNIFCNGFFSVICRLPDRPGEKNIDGEWLVVKPELEDCFAYDPISDAIGTTELWLETYYPSEASSLFREECVERGLIISEDVKVKPSHPAPQIS